MGYLAKPFSQTFTAISLTIAYVRTVKISSFVSAVLSASFFVPTTYKLNARFYSEWHDSTLRYMYLLNV